MALLTQFANFFISPFGEPSVTDELNTFLRSHRIVNVEKRLVDSERGTGWFFMVEYGGEPKNAPSSGFRSGGLKSQPRVDYREILSPADYALFDKLRDERKAAADEQGIPVYAVFTNEHLASIVKQKPKTAKDLLAISGIGEARVKQYGERFLRVLRELGVDNSAADSKKKAPQDETDKPPF